MEKEMNVKEAREFLERQGYFTENLWHIQNVKSRYECTDEEAQEILEDVFHAESVYNTIYFNIDYFSRERGLKRKDD